MSRSERVKPSSPAQQREGNLHLAKFFKKLPFWSSSARLRRVCGANFTFKPTSVSLDALVSFTPSVTGRESRVVQAPRHWPRPFPHTELPCCCLVLLLFADVLAVAVCSGWLPFSFLVPHSGSVVGTVYSFIHFVLPFKPHPHPQLLFLKAS